MLKLIVGLGNPGKAYEKTRHNIGFMLVDLLRKKWNASGPIKKFQAEVYHCQETQFEVFLVKPQTFMNLSGGSVGQLLRFYRLRAEDLIVIHDDLDLPAFTIRIKTGGGSGGHNGLKSIQSHLALIGLDFHRVRLGIGHPERGEILQTKNLQKKSPADYVLEAFEKTEGVQLEQFLEYAAQAVEVLLKEGPTLAMNNFNSTKK